MKYKEQGVLKVLMSADRFMDKYADTLPATDASAARGTLREVLREMEDEGAAQHWAFVRSTSGTELRDELRERLRLEQMQPVAMIARAKVLGRSADYMQAYRVPAMRSKDRDLLVAARAMRDAAVEYRELFEQDLGMDFLARFDEATMACGNALLDRNGNRGERARATASLKATRRKALELLGVLNALVVREARDKPDVMEEWKMLRRVPRKPGVAQGSARAEQVLAPEDPVVGMAA